MTTSATPFRVTVFMGAGAAIEIGGPSTKAITQQVRSTPQIFFKDSVNYIEEVAQVLDEYYREDCNFEEIFHALEIIVSLKRGWRGAVKEYTPLVTAFTQPFTERLFNQDDIIVYTAQRNIIEKVAEMIHAYDHVYIQNVQNKWHQDFWGRAADTFKMDIGTLNYDRCIEQIIPNYEDGFEETEHAFERFNPKKILFSDNTKVMHLHGCITYGHAHTKDPNQYTFEDDWNDIYKYKSYQDAKYSWSGRSTHTAQSADEAIIGPLITGMRKTDKVINYPYSCYGSILHDAIIKNNALLVIGYSFGDIHFNRQLDRILRSHGDKRRVVIIAKHHGEYWHRDWTAMDWPENRDMFAFISKVFKEYYPFRNYHFKSPLISEDGRARLYLNGFKEAVENHQNEILNFLVS